MSQPSHDQQSGALPLLPGEDSLGIVFERPRYPSYAILAVRQSSFNGWPTDNQQEPTLLAEAGLFYTGKYPVDIMCNISNPQQNDVSYLIKYYRVLFFLFKRLYRLRSLLLLRRWFKGLGEGRYTLDRTHTVLSYMSVCETVSRWSVRVRGIAATTGSGECILHSLLTSPY
jgi:hypothetical protein